MALRLEVISNHRQQLGPQASIVLGASGGSIGRALDNDWALPDPQRYLSGHHARITFRDGRYHLEDTSTNGVFINGAIKPLGRGTAYALRSGTLLRMGDYHMRVHIDDTPPPADDGAPPWQLAGAAEVEHVVPLHGGGPREDLDSPLNIETLVPALAEPQARADAAVDAAAAGLAAAEGNDPLESSPTIPPVAPLAVSTQHRLARLRVAARARMEGHNAPLADVRSALEAFGRGAGIDVARIRPEAQAEALHLAGRLLRESLLGLKEVLRAQQASRDRLGIEVEPPEGPSPLDAPADEYLTALLLFHEQRSLDAVLQLRAQFAHAAADAAAPDPALRNALAQFLAHLAPARMETGPGAEAAAASWGRYKDIYANLLQSTGEELPHLFLEALALAWLEARTNRK